MTETATTETPKRKPGRPKGLGRVPGSGRAKGVPNKANAITRDFIIREGAPVDFLCKVVKGRGFSVAAKPGDSERSKQFPTMDQRLQAARILAGKVMPDQKAVEHSGVAGEPLSVRINLGA